MVERLVLAKSHVPFVQANLVDAGFENPDFVAQWRDRLRSRGVWANDPVPIFPYPGSNIYRRKWGEPDDLAWERALHDYLEGVTRLSELQDAWSMPAAVGS